MVKIGFIKCDAGGIQHVNLQNSSSDLFLYTYQVEEDRVNIKIESYESKEDTFHDIAFLTEWHTKRKHPHKIVIDAPKELNSLLLANGYYPKGKKYQKLLDPWRLKLKDSVFDEEGYIIDQGSMASVPFGWFNTEKKGCGWIAAYNLLKANGIQENIQTVIQDLEKHNILGKVLGQEIFWLLVYLKEKGLDISLSIPGYHGCVHACMKYDSGILAYSHSRGAHYAMFTSEKNGTVHFYNAIYQKRDHITKMEIFLESNTILHGCFVVGCRKKEWK